MLARLLPWSTLYAVGASWCLLVLGPWLLWVAVPAWVLVIAGIAQGLWALIAGRIGTTSPS